MKVRNISEGPRGAYLKGKLFMAEPGEEIEADDFCEEWFEKAEPKAKAEAKAEPKAKAKAKAETETETEAKAEAEVKQD